VSHFYNCFNPFFIEIFAIKYYFINILEPLTTEKRQFGPEFEPIREKQRRQSWFHSTHQGGTFSNSNFNSGAELLGGYLGKGSHSNCKGCWTEAEFGPYGKK